MSRYGKTPPLAGSTMRFFSGRINSFTASLPPAPRHVPLGANGMVWMTPFPSPRTVLRLHCRALSQPRPPGRFRENGSRGLASMGFCLRPPLARSPRQASRGSIHGRTTRLFVGRFPSLLRSVWRFLGRNPRKTPHRRNPRTFQTQTPHSLNATHPPIDPSFPSSFRWQGALGEISPCDPPDAAT